MEIVKLDSAQFTEFAENTEGALFFQSPEWIEVKRQNGWSGEILGFIQDGKIIAGTVVLFKSLPYVKIKMAYAPRGFLLDYSNFELLEEFTVKIREYLKGKGVAFLKINPYVDFRKRDINGEIIENTEKTALMEKLKELGYIHYGFYIDQDTKKDLEPRWISVLDLKGQTMDSLYKNMRSGTKWGINNSKKNFIRLIDANEGDLTEFKNLMKHTAERRDFIDRPLSYYTQMYKVLSEKEGVRVLLAEIDFASLLNANREAYEKNSRRLTAIEGNPKKENEARELTSQQEVIGERIKTLEGNIAEFGERKIIAGGWYMLYGKELVYLFGASYKPFMKYNSQYLLQYEMINYAVEHGYERFNFYGIDGNFDKDSKNFGLFDFKRGFGAVVHELIGEFDLIVDPLKYKAYNGVFAGYKLLKKVQKAVVNRK